MKLPRKAQHHSVECAHPLIARCGLLHARTHNEWFQTDMHFQSWIAASLWSHLHAREWLWLPPTVCSSAVASRSLLLSLWREGSTPETCRQGDTWKALYVRTHAYICAWKRSPAQDWQHWHHIHNIWRHSLIEKIFTHTHEVQNLWELFSFSWTEWKIF